VALFLLLLVKYEKEQSLTFFLYYCSRQNVFYTATKLTQSCKNKATIIVNKFLTLGMKSSCYKQVKCAK